VRERTEQKSALSVGMLLFCVVVNALVVECKGAGAVVAGCKVDRVFRTLGHLGAVGCVKLGGAGLIGRDFC
jgi:hypothetical protein